MTTRITTVTLGVLLTILLAAPAAMTAQQSAEPMILLKGFCPVTAKEKQELIEGSKEILAKVPFEQWGNFNFRFATDEYLAMYNENPEKYVPAICGYCPVALHDNQGKARFEFGDPGLTQEVDGKTYWFSSAENQKTFSESIEKNDFRYIPVLGGDCITCWTKIGAKIPGNPFHRKIVGDRIYLFPNSATHDDFEVNQSKYENRDIALAGTCPVAKSDGKTVVGKTELATLHHGMIYRFENEANRNRFLENPAEFEVR